MAAEAWLSIIGIGEDGLEDCSESTRRLLAQARRVFGGPRHLALAGIEPERAEPWPVPFDIGPLLAWRGQPVVALVSGDPFWFGAGSVLARALPRQEWQAVPAPSTFTLAASALGWPLEEVRCLGLHAQPLRTLWPQLGRGRRLLCLLRDEAALQAALALLREEGFGASTAWALQRLGGPRQRVERFVIRDGAPTGLQAPLALALDLHDGPEGLPACAGLPDALFEHDGQLTKAPMRALTLQALAPRPGQRLWDLGAGSGSVSIEWCLAGGVAEAVERDAARAERVQRNAERFGLTPRLRVWPGEALATLAQLPEPQAVFVGGGMDEPLWRSLQPRLPAGCRVVVNAVTTATQALLAQLHERHGGQLRQIALAEAQPLGPQQGFVPWRPQWQWVWQVPSAEAGGVFR